MLTLIEQVLDSQTVAYFRQRLAQADWQEGLHSAGSLAAYVKRNRQLPENSEVGQELGQILIRTLSQHPLFVAAALPEQIYPPRFNAYSGGEHYGTHVDSAIMHYGRQRHSLRSDLSATVFLADPDSYEGGELTIETRYGAQTVKLAAGDMVLYPSDSLHQVTPVTSGERLCAFFWIQSLVRDDSARSLLFDLDQTIQHLTASGTDKTHLVKLTGIYHNLLRRWADV